MKKIIVIGMLLIMSTVKEVYGAQLPRSRSSESLSQVKAARFSRVGANGNVFLRESLTRMNSALTRLVIKKLAIYRADRLQRHIDAGYKPADNVDDFDMRLLAMSIGLDTRR